MNAGFGSLSIEWLAPLYTQKLSAVVEMTDKQTLDDSGVKLPVPETLRPYDKR